MSTVPSPAALSRQTTLSRSSGQQEADITFKTLPFPISLGIALTGCMSVLPPASFEGTQPQLRPEDFFAGATTSTGVLETPSGAPTRKFHVEGRGQPLADGGFRLDQSVTFGNKAPKSRTWVMRRLDEHHYTATLTDASGSVRAEAYGNLFHLRYSMKSPVAGEMEQWMYLQPDGRTVVNEATVRSFGIVAGHLSERITKANAVSPRS